VFGIDLAIDQLHSFLLQLLHIADKGVFAGVADGAEHTLSKKHLAHPDAIQTANQFPFLPDLRAVSVSRQMQAGIGLADFVGDPGTLLSAPRNGFAFTYYLPEIRIDPEIECISPDQLSHAFAFFQLVWKKDKSRIGAPPKNMPPLIPGKDALPVGE
jgi:hypothetical protein